VRSIWGLGLPIVVGQSTTEAFESILAKIRGLVGGWSEKLLSGVAKEVLVKSVAQSIATYPMNCFLLSSTTRKKITSAISNYWWGAAADSRAITTTYIFTVAAKSINRGGFATASVQRSR